MVGFPLPVRSPAVKPASYHRSRTAARLNALTLVYIVYNAARILSNKTLPALRLFQYFIFAHNYIKYRSQHRVTLSPYKKQFRASERRAAVGKSAMAGSPCGQVGNGREPLRASRDGREPLRASRRWQGAPAGKSAMAGSPCGQVGDARTYLRLSVVGADALVRPPTQT